MFNFSPCCTETILNLDVKTEVRTEQSCLFLVTPLVAMVFVWLLGQRLNEMTKLSYFTFPRVIPNLCDFPNKLEVIGHQRLVTNILQNILLYVSKMKESQIWNDMTVE